MKMKRILSLTMTLVLAFALALSFPAVAEETRTVTFYTNEEMVEVFATQTVPYKGKATKPDPDPEPYTVGGYRYEFDAWYRKINGNGSVFNFNSTIRNNTELYAAYTQYLAEGYRLVIFYSGGVAFITDTTTPIGELLASYSGITSQNLEKYDEGDGDTHTHNYDFAHPSWSWAEDHSSASVSINCLNEPTHTEIVAATVTSETTPATCTKTGLTVYTASATFEGQNLSDEQSVELPMIAHDPVFQSVDWNVDEEGNFGAYFAYQCSACGQDSEVFVLPSGYTESKGWRTYTATDAQGNTATSEPIQQFYTVVFNGEALPTMYAWGDECLLSSPDEVVKAWYKVTDGVETLIADGVNACNFAVTENITVVTKETEHQTKQPVICATLVSESSGTAVFNAMWSIPGNAEVKSAIIYRGYTTKDKDVAVETMIDKGTQFDTELLVHNGSYRLNLSQLDANKYQHVMIRVTYTVDGGEEIRLDSAVLRVLPNGGQA